MNLTAMCNELAVHMILSMILFKSGRGSIVANMTYGEAIENPDNRSEIQTPFGIDKLMGTYYSGSQKSKLKYYQQYPGIEGFPMAASRITIGLLDLKEVVKASRISDFNC